MSLAGLGLLGGTFDPIHSAHVELARAALRSLPLECVLLIPAGEPALKPRCQASGEHRLHMVELAIRDDPRLRACSIELLRAGPSYTVDTLRALRAQEPERPLWFLIGTDALAGLEAWREPEALLELASLAVVDRAAAGAGRDLRALLPPSVARELHGAGESLAHPSGNELRRLPFEPSSISSSEIRAQLRAGRSVEGWLPGPVLDYIHELGLYQEDP